MLEFLHGVWRPALEIFLLAIGIYYVFTFVRGTRGASIVTGFLAIVLTLSLVTALLELTVLRWLLGSITTFFVVAVLVIFQPEIRRMLAQVGNLEVFGNVHEQRENIEIIIQTAERLSEVRIGALIAIEQTHQLHDMVESGVPVDCVATPEMLETIFFPNNAIHDGGVIIKGDRIAFAACIFPLTRRQDLNKSLGHRIERGIRCRDCCRVGGNRGGFLCLQGPVDARGDARKPARLPQFDSRGPAEAAHAGGLDPGLESLPAQRECAGRGTGGCGRPRSRAEAGAARGTAHRNRLLTCRCVHSFWITSGSSCSPWCLLR
jgi:diadenylate cyclase